MTNLPVELSIDPTDSDEEVGLEPFTQTIRLRGSDGVIATTAWTCGDLAGGVVQIVNINVSKAHQRRGHGSRLLDAMVKEAAKYHAARKSRLRRLWMGIAQKSQVNARAFATSRGFTHVGSVQQLLREEDLLIYMRTFD